MWTEADEIRLLRDEITYLRSRIDTLRKLNDNDGEKIRRLEAEAKVEKYEQGERS